VQEEEGKWEGAPLSAGQGRPGMGSGGVRCLRDRRHERSHRAVTGSVVSGAGVVTGAPW
jgi:hypothetical protein